MNELAERLRALAVYLTWGLGLALLCIPAFSVYLLTRDERIIFKFARFGCRLGFRVGGVHVEVRGLEKLDPAQPYVFAGNHSSNLDPPLLFVYLERDVGFLAKKEVFRLPVLNPGLLWMESTPVDRSNREAAIASLRRAAQIIRRGRSYIAFPEGTRSPDGRLLPFKKGTFYLAREAGVPIVPVTITGVHRLMPKGQFRARPGVVRILVHDPIPIPSGPGRWIEEMKSAVRSSIESAMPAETGSERKTPGNY